jgi:photosystem II stability/assembly factor-like uncharacterized protein
MKFLATIFLLFFVSYYMPEAAQGQEYLKMIDAGNYSVKEIQESAEAFFEGKDKGRGSGYKQYKRWEYKALRMMDDSGYLKLEEQYLREWEKLNAEMNERSNKFRNNSDFWEEMGPTSWFATTGWNPGVGRLTGFSIDENNENHMIAGAESGGVWKTLDGGKTWTPLLDYFSNMYVNSVVIDQNEPNIYYFGSTQGRIYKSVDAGETWIQLTSAGNSSIRKILLHPEDSSTMFACGQNAGVYRSQNGGTTWTKVISDNAGFDVEFKPGDLNIMYAVGNNFFKSTDGGISFEQKSNGEGGPKILTINTPSGLQGSYQAVDNSFTSGRVPVPTFPESLTGDLALILDDVDGTTSDGCNEAFNPDQLAGKIVVIRRGVCSFSVKVLSAQKAGAIGVIIVNNVGGEATAMGGGNGEITIPAVMVSRDLGEILINELKAQNSTPINVTLQNQEFDDTGAMSTGPKVIGVSADNPEIVYVLEAAGGIFGGFYKSEDSGETFIKPSHTGKNYFGYSTFAEDDRGQAPRNMDIAVNPFDANEVHIGGILSWISKDGGTNFECTSDWIPGSAENKNIGYCHADINAMGFYNDKLFVVSDGGIYKAENTQEIAPEYYEDLTAGMGIRHFYRIGLSQTDPVVVSSGSQDNGTSWYSQSTGWTDWLGADGMETFVDGMDSNILYGTSQFGSLYKKNLFGGVDNITQPGSQEGNWVTPFEKDPVLPNTIYVGYEAVFKSDSDGAVWDQISQEFPNKLDHLKISPSNPNVMYASHGNSLYKTVTGNGEWEQLSGFTGNINDIAIHPKNPDKIAIATTNTQKIFISNDGGSTWTPYRKNLPNFAANAVVWQDGEKEGLYIGMNYGVFYNDNTMTTWEPFVTNLPNVIINELEINYAESKIYAATYGRGLWSSPLFDASPSSTKEEIIAKISVFPNPAIDLVSIISDVEMNDTDIEVYNNVGQIVIKKSNQNFRNQTINVNALPTGVYYLRMTNKQGQLTEKFSVMK